MAATLTLQQAAFDLSEVKPPGTGLNAIRAVEKVNGRIVVKSIRDNPINNFTVVDNDGSDSVVRIIGGPDKTVQRFTANFDDGDDRLVLGAPTGKQTASTIKANINMGDGNDTFKQYGPFRGSTFDAGDGDDTARFISNGKNAAVGSSIDMGEGNDLVIFGGGVVNSSISLGTGADTIEFRTSSAKAAENEIKNTTLDLGGDDGATDVVRIADGVDFSGLTITGEEAGDVLFIGSTEYTYDPTTDQWVNGSTRLDF